MPNSGIFTNLCFTGVNSKRRDFQQEEKNNNCSSLCHDRLSGSRQTSKKMARELCRNNIFCVATQDLKKLADELCRNRRNHVTTENGKKSTKTKISYVAT